MGVGKGEWTLATKEEILALLKNREDFVSGQDLAEHFQMTRSAVWKHMAALRDMGYEIESVPAKGYRLRFAPNTMYAHEINAHLRTCWLGRNYRYETEVTSTNTVLKEMAEKDAPHGMVVAAGHQTAGKGRLGRKWSSAPYSGIWYSLLLRPDFPPQMAGVITLAAAVSVAQALEQFGVPVKIKWPNDILLNGKKLCGILSEMRGDMDHIQWIVVGIGVNLTATEATMPEEIRAVATSLTMSGFGDVPQNSLAAEILNRMEENYDLLCAEGFAPIRAEWMARGAFLNESITVNTIRGQMEGIFRGIDGDGCLLMERSAGKIERIAAGDVTTKNQNQK